MEYNKLNIRRLLFRLYIVVLTILSLIFLISVMVDKSYMKTSYTYETPRLTQEQKMAVQKHDKLVQKIKSLKKQAKFLIEEKINADYSRRTDISLQIYSINDVIDVAEKELKEFDLDYYLAQPNRIEHSSFDVIATASFLGMLLIIWIIPFALHFTVEWLIGGLRG